MTKPNEHPWDTSRPGSTEAFERKMGEWAEREWTAWLAVHLAFPFKAIREEDFEHSFFDEDAARAPFGVGHTMEILGGRIHVSKESDLPTAGRRGQFLNVFGENVSSIMRAGTGSGGLSDPALLIRI
jgi:hypothetical protein